MRGRLSDDRAQQILRFWARAGALDDATARQRLPEVVCVLVDDRGEIAGVNSVQRSEVELIGGREFWLYRNFVLPAAAGMRGEMVSAAFRALQAEFDPAVAGPIGMCLLIGDRGTLRRNPTAEWVYPRFLYAGYLGDGRQVRILYFAGARIGRPRPWADSATTLDRNYRVHVFAEQDTIGADAVADLWVREGVVTPDEARRRVDEVLLVATDAAGEPVGISTAYLQRNHQLRMDLWHVRVFVAAQHRASRVATALAVVTRDELQVRFVSGADTRGAGILMEVENEGLKRHMDYAVWGATDSTFIGENARGDHVRVHYFPGALAPEPPE